MKTKYGFTIHFYRISPKSERAKMGEFLKEYQNFAESYWKYKFYYYLTPETIPATILGKLGPELQTALNDQDLRPHFDSARLARAKDVFFGTSKTLHTVRIESKLNVQLLQYALEQVRNHREDQTKRQRSRAESRLGRQYKEGLGRWGSMSLQCCNMLFYLCLLFVVYFIAKYIFGVKWEQLK